MFVYLLILPSSFFKVFPFLPRTGKLLSDFCVNRRCAKNCSVFSALSRYELGGRFVRGPCCYAAGHMINFGDPGFIREMVKDLSRVFQLLKRSLPNVKVIEGMELICGKNTIWRRRRRRRPPAGPPMSSTPPATPMPRWRYTSWKPSPLRTHRGQVDPRRRAAAAAVADPAANERTASASRRRETTDATGSDQGTGRRRSKGGTSHGRIRISTAVPPIPPAAPSFGEAAAAVMTAASSTAAAAAEGPTTGAGRSAASAATD
jgi:hypothetical protein